eukprot:6182879-Pleurochrysis_carterae.AAC.1
MQRAHPTVLVTAAPCPFCPERVALQIAAKADWQRLDLRGAHERRRRIRSENCNDAKGTGLTFLCCARQHDDGQRLPARSTESQRRLRPASTAGSPLRQWSHEHEIGLRRRAHQAAENAAMPTREGSGAPGRPRPRTAARGRPWARESSACTARRASPRRARAREARATACLPCRGLRCRAIHFPVVRPGLRALRTGTRAVRRLSGAHAAPMRLGHDWTRSRELDPLSPTDADRIEIEARRRGREQRGEGVGARPTAQRRQAAAPRQRGELVGLSLRLPSMCANRGVRERLSSS